MGGNKICSVDGCENRLQCGLSFFRCPKEQRRCQIWKNVLGFTGSHKYSDFTPEQCYTSIRICALHFDEDSFANSSRSRIHSYAVPSLRLTIKSVEKDDIHTSTTDYDMAISNANDDNGDQFDVGKNVRANDACVQTSYLDHADYSGHKGELLHKKWKNIRDRFAREIQDTKYESRKRTPYLHAQQLQFLKDTLSRKKTSNSSEHAEKSAAEEEMPAGTSDNKRQRQEEEEETPNNKRAKIQDDDDNRHFLLSLLPSLSSLPRWLNTNCRVEIMQCISKYETYALHQYQSPFSVPQLHLVPAPPQHSPRSLREDQDPLTRQQVKSEALSPVNSFTSEVSNDSAEDSKFNIF